MAAELITPVDEFSGIPLPILPTKHELPVNKPEIADWHHPFHPKGHPLLRTTGGLAVRNCRIQLVHRNFHNESPTRYHRFYEGPPLPETEDDQFRIVVLACAGYVPSQAIDLRSGDPRVVDMNYRQQAQLRRTVRRATSFDNYDKADPGRNKIFQYRNLRYGFEPIRDFLGEYALSKEVAHIKNYDATVDEFLHSPRPERRKFLGHLLLAKKIEVAAASVEPIYQDALHEGLLHPLMPHVPRTLVKHKLGTPSRREELFPLLEQSLLAS